MRDISECTYHTTGLYPRLPAQKALESATDVAICHHQHTTSTSITQHQHHQRGITTTTTPPCTNVGIASTS